MLHWEPLEVAHPITDQENYLYHKEHCRRTRQLKYNTASTGHISSLNFYIQAPTAIHPHRQIQSCLSCVRYEPGPAQTQENLCYKLLEKIRLKKAEHWIKNWVFQQQRPFKNPKAFFFSVKPSHQVWDISFSATSSEVSNQ